MTSATAQQLDPATIEQLRPPCEWYEFVSGMVSSVACDHPAAWIIRSRCTACGHIDTQLVCNPHHGAITGGSTTSFCPGCLVLGSATAIAEPLS